MDNDGYGYRVWHTTHCWLFDCSKLLLYVCTLLSARTRVRSTLFYGKYVKWYILTRRTEARWQYQCCYELMCMHALLCVHSQENVKYNREDLLWSNQMHTRHKKIGIIYWCCHAYNLCTLSPLAMPFLLFASQFCGQHIHKQFSLLWKRTVLSMQQV